MKWISNAEGCAITLPISLGFGVMLVATALLVRALAGAFQVTILGF